MPIEFYRAFREGRCERDLRGNRSSGGNFYVTKARDLGRGYVRTVTDAHSRNVIDVADAPGATQSVGPDADRLRAAVRSAILAAVGEAPPGLDAAIDRVLRDQEGARS